MANPPPTLTVNVTQEDIDKGKPKNCRFCPIAMALRRLTGDSWFVDGYEASVLSGGDYLMPEVAYEFVKNFDAGYSVKPITFDVTLDTSDRPEDDDFVDGYDLDGSDLSL